MKKRIFIFTVILSMLLLLLPACSTAQASAESDKSGSLKSITKPYIGEYECTDAHLGKTDLLEKYEFITISLLDDKKMEVSYKPKDGKKKTFEGTYEVNPDTREFTGEVGILGVKFKEGTKIENGKFTITKLIFSMPLIMNFKMK
ncbi:MAG: hypothetical protein K2O89_01280 [Clostridia bacterium]|nr:hypothetical protein [Clostridia bacterium]